MIKLTLLSLLSAPCPPSGVEYTGNHVNATVSWSPSVFATTYTVYDDSVTPRAPVCSTGHLNCILSNINSTNLVITASNAAGESEATQVPNGMYQWVPVRVSGKDALKWEPSDFFVFHKRIDLKLFSLVTTQGRRRRDLSQQMVNNDGKVDL